jgi:nucleoporin POM152
MLCLNGRTVSIEDVYECKRPVSVPGISVNVRRVKVRTSLLVEKQAPTFFLSKPTAKFYGESLTVLEQERASLPLRLTGDGVSFLVTLYVPESECIL